jgi:nucleoside-diphosphate-sugar epimerase
VAVASSSAPRILVLGGTGAVGGGVVERARELGFAVTAAGRSALPASHVRERLLDLGVPYAGVDLVGAQAESQLAALLAHHDLVVLACEPWSEAEAGRSDAVASVVRFYDLARSIGFDVAANRARAERGESQRRIVRIGSSVAELPHALIDGSTHGHPEDWVSQDALDALANEDPYCAIPYFRAKSELARAASEASHRGVDLVTALPTYVISWWGDRGREEPLAQALRAAKRTGLVPSVPVNALPADVAATGILLAGLVGRSGERYQLCGVETDTHALHALSLRHLGLHPRRLPVPRRELEDELRLLSGRRRTSPWLDLWLLPWDLWRRSLLRDHEVAAWHLAVMLEGSDRRGDKVRTLRWAFRRDSERAELRYPEETEIRSRLEIAARRKMEWLETLGLPVDGASRRSASASV